MKVHGRLAAAVIIGLLVPSLHAQDAWMPVRGIRPGTAVIVTMTNGSRLDGILKATTGQELIVAMESGADRVIARAETQTIIVSSRDSVLDGILIGAGAGFGGGAALGAAWFYGSGRYGAKPPGYGAEFISGIGVISSAIGAVVGWRLDSGRTRAELVYQAP